jgi:Holliday junction resolvase YEN1
MPIALLAAEHFEQHRRPLRIAIDEPYWWFNNVTKEQEIFIRK